MARTARTDWIAVGLAMLRKDGHHALTIASLCARAGATRGSFYHHYADLGTFKNALLTAWRTEFTDRVIERTQGEPDAAARRELLDDLALALDRDIERAIRDWAAHDPKVGAVVRRVDRQRIAYLAGLIAQVSGNPARIAGQLALIEYVIFLGTQQLRDAADAKLIRILAPRIGITLTDDESGVSITHACAALGGSVPELAGRPGTTAKRTGGKKP